MNSLKLQTFGVLVRHLWLSCIFLIPGNVLSQIQFEKFQGVVIDSTTLQPIPQVNVWTSHSNTISDADGNFSLFLMQGDTLHFSHISYHSLKVKHENKNPSSKVWIALRQNIRVLDEVKIFSNLSENAFRQKIMETVPVLSREEAIAQINSKIITYLARYAPAFPMNANDNYIEYMKGPQPVVIFSSKPSKGLIRAIKNVVGPSLPSYKRFYHADSLMKASRNR